MGGLRGQTVNRQLVERLNYNPTIPSILLREVLQLQPVDIIGRTRRHEKGSNFLYFEMIVISFFYLLPLRYKEEGRARAAAVAAAGLLLAHLVLLAADHPVLE